MTPEEFVRNKHQTRVADREHQSKKFRAECSCGTLISRWRATYQEAMGNAEYHVKNKIRREVKYREARGIG